MPNLIGGDRRTSTRYDLALPARFSFAAGGSIATGNGITSDVSSSGVLLKPDGEPPPVGVAIEVDIDWPYLLQGVCPLGLFLRGKVIESSARGVVVAIQSKAFRTRGVRSFEEDPQMPSMSLVA